MYMHTFVDTKKPKHDNTIPMSMLDVVVDIANG